MAEPVTELREQVRERYASAAVAVTAAGRDALAVLDAERCCAPSEQGPSSSCCGEAAGDAAFGATLYGVDQQADLPADAVAASLGCGNPTAVAELQAGETVLDL